MLTPPLRAQVAAAEAAVREEERQLEEAAHAEAFEIVEWIVGRLLGVVVEECERKAREAASCGRLKLQSAMRKLRGADILGLAVVRLRREINWGLDPPDRWRLQKQLKIDGPAHRRRERIQVGSTAYSSSCYGVDQHCGCLTAAIVVDRCRAGGLARSRHSSPPRRRPRSSASPAAGSCGGRCGGTRSRAAGGRR